MKRIRAFAFLLVVALALLSHSYAQGKFHDCPAKGDADDSRSDVALNLLKNREEAPPIFKLMPFKDLAGLEVPDGVSKKHRSQWPVETLTAVEKEEKKAVQVVGFLLAVKLEGEESPNCHSNDQTDRDFHLWLAKSEDDEKADAVVIEITPRIRAKHTTWTSTKLRQLAKSKTRVRISGWILLDPEHPDQVGKTRATIWEIHPIIRMETFVAGHWTELKE